MTNLSPDEHNDAEAAKILSKYEATKNPFDLLVDDFDGIILSEKIIEKLAVKEHPFLRISIENELSGKGVKFSGLVACVLHKDGWGYSTPNDK